MFKLKKSILVAIVSLCLAFSVSLSTVAFASAEAKAVGDGVNQTRWTNVSDITLSMTYSGGAVNWRGVIQGKSNTASISATFTLEKLNSPIIAYFFAVGGGMEINMFLG